MEKLIEFFTNRLGITVSIIGGFILPGCLFIYVFDKDMFLEIDLLKLIILASAVCFAIYAVILILSTLVMRLNERHGLKKYDITDILLYPLIYSNLFVYACMLEKLFRKESPITYFIGHWSVAIIIAYVIIHIHLFFSIWRKKRKIKKEEK